MLFLAVLILAFGHPSPTVAFDDALFDATATQVLALFEADALSPRAYVEQLINHTNKNEENINAFITFDPERVLSHIKTTQKYRQLGQCLYGLPIAVKDNIAVNGYPTAAGTPALRDSLPKRSAPVVRRLTQAGAAVFGMANMHELQFGITSNNGFFGPVHNPWNLSLIPGGSSGGSVASVSSRFTPVALCGDTIASCRLPAALTGIMGYRPSKGRYSSKGVTPSSLTLDTIGINARTVDDIVLIDGVITEGTCDQKPTPRAAATIRLGFDQASFLGNVDPDLRDVFNQALATLGAAGVQIIPIDFSQVLAIDQASTTSILFYDWFRDLRKRLRNDYKDPVPLNTVLDQAASPDVIALINAVRNGPLNISKEVYQSAIYVSRPQIQSLFQEFFDSLSLDGIIFPTTRLTARPIGQETVIINGQPEPVLNAYVSFVSFGGSAGVPGISIPIGLTAGSNLPVGMEIEGAYATDKELFNVVATLASLFPPLPRPPEVNFDE